MMKLLKKVKINPLTYIVVVTALLSGLIKYLIIVSIIITIHELGHIIIALIFKRKISKVEILPFGGLVKMNALISENIYEDLLISIGGIFFQTILGFIILILFKLKYINGGLFALINDFNITIITFNLMPINPLDGNKILKLLQELVLPLKKTFIISFLVSIMFLLLIVINNITFVKENILVFIFLIIMIYKEYRYKDYIMNRFYIERMNRRFKFNKNVQIKKKEEMYKNRNNFIDTKNETIFLKEAFYGKNK